MKVKLNPDIISIIEEEVRREKTEVDFPRTLFGKILRDDLYNFTKQNIDKEFEVINIEKNLRIGKDYDLVILKTEIGNTPLIRRFVIEIEEQTLYPSDRLTGWQKDDVRLTIREYNTMAQTARRSGMTTYEYLKQQGYENERAERQMRELKGE